MTWSRRFAFTHFFWRSLFSLSSSDSNESIISPFSIPPNNLRDISIAVSASMLYSSIVFLSFSTFPW